MKRIGRKLLLGVLLGGLLSAAPPPWWTTQGVLTPATPANDYAAANLGQVKSLAAKAAAEFNQRFAANGGAGPAITSLIAAWRQPPAPGAVRNDYAAVNQGQLKAVARLFYDRLAEFGYQGPPLASGAKYPWPAATATTNDYAAANLGQVKYLFSFDPSLVHPAPAGNSLPDWWQLQYFGHTGVDPNAPSGNGDGLTMLQEYQKGRDPTDFFNGETPVLRSISGENQTRVSGYLPNPVVIQVYHADQQTPWPNALLTLHVVEGDGQWAASVGGPTAISLQLRADANGQIKAYYWLP